MSPAETLPVLVQNSLQTPTIKEPTRLTTLSEAIQGFLAQYVPSTRDAYQVDLRSWLTLLRRRQSGPAYRRVFTTPTCSTGSSASTAIPTPGTDSPLRPSLDGSRRPAASTSTASDNASSRHAADRGGERGGLSGLLQALPRRS